MALHERLLQVYGQAAVGVAAAHRWPRQSKEDESGGTEFHDKMWSGTSTALMAGDVRQGCDSGITNEF
jgi:hypothetical protein